jgi:ferrochelatase
MPFLENVTRGRGIPPERLAGVAEHYYAFGGVSPINQQCRDLLDAVRADFAASGVGLPVYWGNRNWHPFLGDTVAQMAHDGVRSALAFATSAFSSYSSCRQYLDDIELARDEVSATGRPAPEIDKIRRFFNHPGFIESFAENARAALETLPPAVRDRAHLVFTAHSIPVAMAASSGPAGASGPVGASGPAGGRYVAELTEASRLITKRIGGAVPAPGDTVLPGGTPDPGGRVPPRHPWTLVYQSRSGPPSQPWLEPDVLDHLEDLAKAGAPAVVVIPVGFISDHMEVRHDLDIEAAEAAARLGLPFARARTPSAHPRFAKMITELVRERLDEGVEPVALGDLGPSSDVCPPGCCAYQRPGQRAGARPAGGAAA